MSTPYDLRFSIYNQAQERLMSKYYSDLDVWRFGKEQADHYDRPSFPTHEQILEEAEKIYEFVQRKD
jgi:hypothetical protein